MTTTGTATDTATQSPSGEQQLPAPGRGGGLGQVFRHRYVLRLLVRKDLKVRYQGSLLGMAWSYIKPGVRFTVYFVVVGMVLGMANRLESFPVYLFSGLIMFMFFMETLNSTTRSVRRNKALVRKLYLPREMFPVASLLVSGFHFLPGLSILVIAALATSWSWSLATPAAALLGFAIVAVFGLAVGLFFSAFNVFFRDFEKVVDVLTIAIRWSAPIIYPWTLIRDRVPGWALQVYLANPLTNAVELFHRAFWYPGNTAPHPFPPHMWLRAVAVLGAVSVLAAAGQVTFSRLEHRFAEEL